MRQAIVYTLECCQLSLEARKVNWSHVLVQHTTVPEMKDCKVMKWFYLILCFLTTRVSHDFETKEYVAYRCDKLDVEKRLSVWRILIHLAVLISWEKPEYPKTQSFIRTKTDLRFHDGSVFILILCYYLEFIWVIRGWFYVDGGLQALAGKLNMRTMQIRQD